MYTQRENIKQGGVIDRLKAFNSSAPVHSTCSDTPTCVISGFFRGVAKNCTLLGNYAAITHYSLLNNPEEPISQIHPLVPNDVQTFAVLI